MEEFSDIVRFGVGDYVTELCLHMEISGAIKSAGFGKQSYLIPGQTYETCIQIVPA